MSFRIGPFDFFVDRAPQFGFFEFDHVRHSPRDRELWFMGRHLVVSKV